MKIIGFDSCGGRPVSVEDERSHQIGNKFKLFLQVLGNRFSFDGHVGCLSHSRSLDWWAYR